MNWAKIQIFFKKISHLSVSLSVRMGTLTIFKKSLLKILYRFPIRGAGDKDSLVLGVYPSGGLGDYIISSKLIDEIKETIPCRIDVFCENTKFGNAVFAEREGIEILEFSKMRRAYLRYDVVLCIEHFTRVWSFNEYRVKRISPEFYDQIKKLEKETKKTRPKIDQQCYREAVHFMRCEKLGIDRWTEQRCGDVFKIPDHKTFIPLKKEFLKRVSELGLSEARYITVNRGADSMGKSGIQTKVWPKEYYDKFVDRFKEKYPHIRVVQLGIPQNEKIENVDQYVLGEDLEVIKWILKGSMVHIDCEGGLVHLATQLGTKCVVLFGPTPLHMYGYEQNINLLAGNCHNCMGMHEEWAFKCFRGLEKPECMYSIKPDMVIDAVVNYLEEEGVT